MTASRVVVVVQARMRSTRLPGKVLSEIEGESMLAWTLGAVRAIEGIADVVVATTTDPSDDAIVEVADDLDVPVHRGPVLDVLTRCHDAVAPFQPEIVVRQTADNPFPDPAIAAAQIRTLVVGGFDYVGISGWPLGIAAETCRMAVLEVANREASGAADREHVLPFVYRQPDRFRIGRLERAGTAPRGASDARYTVDTAADLAFARALAARLGHGAPVALDELEAIVAAEPDLLALNGAIPQRSWRHAQSAEAGRWTS